MHVFKDRAEAGRELARALEHYRGQDVVVLGLPRGGVPVAAEVAAALGAPLDVIVVRKIGVPFQPELAMGAIGEHGTLVTDERVLAMSRVAPEEFEAVEAEERKVLEARVAGIRARHAPVPVAGRTAIIVDDGIATGSTARVACRIARELGAERVVVAAPVGPQDAASSVPDADEVVCLSMPAVFRAVGRFYRDFSPTQDDEVLSLLDAAARRTAEKDAAQAGPTDEDVEVRTGDTVLEGRLHLPPSGGIVVFAHGSGSSRHSPRNRAVARVLEDAGLGTLLMDLLGHHEELDRRAVFDIPLLASRLAAVSRWLRERIGPERPIGWFGASTGAAAALWAAAEPGSGVRAIVSRGGRPDLAGPRLVAVDAPTLLIVGGADTEVLALNRQAAERLRCPYRLEIVPGATHLFEEPGALDTVAELARDWFTQYLA